MEKFVITQAMPCTSSYTVAIVPAVFSITVDSDFGSDELTVSFLDDDDNPLISDTISPKDKADKENMCSIDDVDRINYILLNMITTVTRDVALFLANGFDCYGDDTSPGVLNLDIFAEYWTERLTSIVRKVISGELHENNDE